MGNRQSGAFSINFDLDPFLTQYPSVRLVASPLLTRAIRNLLEAFGIFDNDRPYMTLLVARNSSPYLNASFGAPKVGALAHDFVKCITPHPTRDYASCFFCDGEFISTTN